MSNQPQAHVADERAAFEKTMNDARFFPRELDFTMTKSPSGRDEYANSHLQSVFDGWIARAASTQGVDAAGWKEAAIAWTVCASIHEKYAQGKDALYTKRHEDFVNHERDARTQYQAAGAPAETPKPDEAIMFLRDVLAFDYELDVVDPDHRDSDGRVGVEFRESYKLLRDRINKFLAAQPSSVTDSSQPK